MNMPGFNAGASLYITKEHYKTPKIAFQVEGAIQPTLSRLNCMRNCLQDQCPDPFCVENCRCICFGHPGRTCWLQ